MIEPQKGSAVQRQHQHCQNNMYTNKWEIKRIKKIHCYIYQERNLAAVSIHTLYGSEL